MTKLKPAKRKKALVIVAHPDDESIWMGGFIFKHPELDWTILSLCRASDPDRAPKFKKVCDYLGAKGIIEDLDDEGRLGFEDSVKATKSLITKFLKKSGSFDYIFTHGQNGEYGHEGHKVIHEAIKQLVDSGGLKAEKIYHFNYKKSNNKIIAKADSNLVMNLTKTEFRKKKNLMTQIYGYEEKGIDANYCTNPEAFKIINLNNNEMLR